MDLRIKVCSIATVLALTSGCVSSQTNVKHNFNEPKKFSTYQTIGQKPKYVDGNLRFTIKPGMRGAGTDIKNNTERTEIAHSISSANTVVMKGNFRVNSNERITSWFLISQIKLESSTHHVNPVASIYADNGGAVKCTHYAKGLPNQSFQNKKFLHGAVSLNEWNNFEIQVKFHKTDGECKIFVNGKLVHQSKGRTIPFALKGSKARIGIYRDATLDKSVVSVDFKNWSINQPKVLP